MNGAVYLRSEPGLWTVGYYGLSGRFDPQSDHGSADEAADETARLNAGDDVDAFEVVRSEGHLWTVGFHKPDGKWEPVSDHGSPTEADQRVAWLNGHL